MEPERTATDEERQAIHEAGKKMRDSIEYYPLMRPWKASVPDDPKLRELLDTILESWTNIDDAIKAYEAEEEEDDE